MGNTRIELHDVVLEQVQLKCEEYARLQEFGKSPIGRFCGRQRVIEYAVQLLGWLDVNADDEAVKSVFERFKYQTRVRNQGRPKGIDKLDDISSMNVQVATYRLRAKGIYAPTRKQVREEFNVMVAAGEVHTAETSRKDNVEKAKKVDKIRNDPSLETLDKATESIANKKLVDDKWLIRDEKENIIGYEKEPPRKPKPEILPKTKREDQDDMLRELFGPAGDA